MSQACACDEPLRIAGVVAGSVKKQNAIRKMPVSASPGGIACMAHATAVAVAGCGELRYNLIVDSLVGIIHKKPKEGGISAVGGTGSIYTYYGPEEASFKTLRTTSCRRTCRR